MFEKSQTFRRFGGGSRRTLDVNLGHVPYLEPEPPEARRGMKIAVAAAVVFHLGLFAVVLPELDDEPRHIGREQKVYAVQQVRFSPPPPVAQQQIPKVRQKKRVIPIPDPTPEEPEPIRTVDIELPEVDFEVADDAVFGIPEGPPAPSVYGGVPQRLGGNIQPPVKVYYPQPRYTEDGRQARIQGVVILEAIIDARGDVTNVKVLKGLPLGLDESAVEAAKQWKFEPATLDGEPVPVYLNLTIRFSLQ